jgi:hypothetical protein
MEGEALLGIDVKLVPTVATAARSAIRSFVIVAYTFNRGLEVSSSLLFASSAWREI